MSFKNTPQDSTEDAGSEESEHSRNGLELPRYKSGNQLVSFFDLTRPHRITSSVNSIESNSCQGTDEEGKGFDWNAQKQGSIRKLGFNCGRLRTDMT